MYLCTQRIPYKRDCFRCVRREFRLAILALAACTAFALVASLSLALPHAFGPRAPCSWPGARRVPDDMCRAITTTGFTPEMVYARWV
jgi:hypothetical protein